MRAFWRRKKPGLPADIATLPAEVQNYLRSLESSRERPIQEETYTVLDLETTGLDCEQDRILSFAFLRIDQGEIRLDQRLEGHVILDDQRQLEAVDIHHVTRQEAQTGLSEPELAKRVLEFVGSSVLVGHHIAFDACCLDQLLTRTYNLPLRNRSVDTAQLGARLDNPMMGSYAGTKALKNLDSLCQEYGILPEARHNASGDTYTTALLFLKLLRAAGRRKIKHW